MHLNQVKHHSYYYIYSAAWQNYNKGIIPVLNNMNMSFSLFSKIRFSFSL